MAQVLLWTGIALIVVGWFALAGQAVKIMSRRNETEKFSRENHAMQLRRNYCRLTIIAGILLVIISMLI